MTEVVNGILLVNKPQGLSSNAVLQRAKRLMGAKKAGHTGSLDPLATGMLPICFGEATKFSQYLLDADKTYQVTGVLGCVTDTGDADGTVIKETHVPHIPQEALDGALADLRGSISQLPPMYSALKYQGKPLYTYARRGEDVPRKARNVTIYAIRCDEFDGKSFNLTVTCSKGTYIRSLVESIGEALQVGAFVKVLHRVSTAGFESDAMVTLEALEQEDIAARRACLLPVERAIIQFPRVDINAQHALMLTQGKRIPLSSDDGIKSGIVRLYSEGALLGLGLCDVSEETIKVKRLLQTANG